LDGGRTFAPAITVNDDAGGPPSSHTFHNMVVTADGTIVVSWLDNRRAETATGDAATGDAIDGDAAEAAAAGHVDAADGIDPTIPGPDVRIAVSADGGATFSASRVVDQQTCPCCRTSLTVAPDGTIYLGWRKIFQGDVRDIVIARSSDLGRSWDEPRRVAADDWVFPGCPHAGPSLAVDPTGTLHVAWYTGREGAPGLYHATSRDRGVTFSAPVTLLGDAWVPPSQVALSAGADGTLHAAWEDLRADAPRFFYTTVSGRALDPMGAEPLAGSNPALAQAGGRVALTWLDGDRVRLRVAGAAH
jgi:hypothetical protein